VEELGGYRELTASARVVGALVFAAVLVVVALLERLQFRLRATEQKTWWGSNGRDVLNALALGAMALGLKAIGYTGPIALAIAATMVIALSALQGALAKFPRLSSVLSMTAALAIGVPVTLLPRAVHGLFREAIERLFQGLST
jgi:hypothetical protein